MGRLTALQRIEAKAARMEAETHLANAETQRLIGQAKLALATRYYEAVQPNAQRPRRGNLASADTVMDRSQNRLREYGRWLDENHDMAVGVLDDLVTNIVGVGAGIEPMAVNQSDRSAATDLNRNLSELWREFWEFPEVTGELPGTEVERLVCRSWLRDGEVFAQHVTLRTAPFSTRIPYALELLEADFVPFWLIDPSTNTVHGIQKDGWGRPLVYNVLKQHPGNLLKGATAETKPMSADRILHLKFVRRLHQTRGVSLFHAVLTRLDDLKDYEESERIAARVAAALTAYIKKSSDGDLPMTTAPSGDRGFEMTPGLIFDGLLPGEDVGVIDSKRPNPNLEPYRNAMVRAVASGTGTRFSSIAKNYNGTYSAQRQELVEAVQHYRRLFSYLRDRFYLPVWRRFVDSAQLAGLLKIPKSVDLVSVYRPEIRPPQMVWIDPRAEATAMQLMVESGFKSRQQIIRDMGGDPATVNAQIEADPLSGMFPSTNPTQPTPGAPPVPSKTNPMMADDPNSDPAVADPNALQEAA